MTFPEVKREKKFVAICKINPKYFTGCKLNVAQSCIVKDG
jgi:hypothetical protein